MNALIELQPPDLRLALGLMAMAIGLSFWQQLGLTWNLALATIRTLVQLQDSYSVESIRSTLPLIRF